MMNCLTTEQSASKRKTFADFICDVSSFAFSGEEIKDRVTSWCCKARAGNKRKFTDDGEPEVHTKQAKYSEIWTEEDGAGNDELNSAPE
jgi:hypothetical protein